MSEALGQHTLMEGDCLQRLADVADGSVDMVFADLPYGVTRNKWDTPIDLAALWAHLLRVGKKNAAFVFTATQPFATTLINSQPKLFRYDLVWCKSIPSGHLNAKRMPLRQHETLLVFYRSLCLYNPQRCAGGRVGKNTTGRHSSNYGAYAAQKQLMDGLQYPRSVFSVAMDAGRQSGSVRVLHPTQKPVALLEWLIKTYSNPGDTVLDPTAGSGTTLIAAENTDRRCIAIERDPTYCEAIRKRWRDTPVRLWPRATPPNMTLTNPDGSETKVYFDARLKPQDCFVIDPAQWEKPPHV